MSPGKTETNKRAGRQEEKPARFRQEGWVTRFSRETERKLFFYLTLILGAWWVIAQFFK